VRKHELVEQVADRAEISREQATRAVDAVIEAVEMTLRGGGELTVSGFGRFSVSERGAREGINPRTGERMRIPAVRIPRFSPGAALKRAVRGS